MFFPCQIAIVVLMAIASASAKPGIIPVAAPLAYSAPFVAPVAAPVVTAHSSQVVRLNTINQLTFLFIKQSKSHVKHVYAF